MKKLITIIFILGLFIASMGMTFSNKILVKTTVNEDLKEVSTNEDLKEENSKEDKISEENQDKEKDPIIVISLVGDILFDGHIKNHINKEGYDYPWKYVSEYFQNDHISIGNLETSITNRGEKWPDKYYNFRSDPKNLPAMKKAGIEVLSLANNHSLDYGYEGLKDTLMHLKASDIKTLGAGVDRESAREAVIIEKEGVKIGLLGFSRVVPHVDWWATDSRPGLVGAYDGQMKAVLEDIENLKSQVDILIVSIHWGKELHETPRAEEISVAKKMIDMGADAIVGHHPHVLQAIEIYKARPIFYSLGNFVFGTKSKGTANTIIAQLKVKEGKIENINIIPLEIINSRPERLDEVKRQEKLDYLRKLSKDFNTVINKDGIININ